MNPTFDFEGQVALVTGAGSGIGLATAKAFAEAGAAVVLAGHGEKALNAAAHQLVEVGHKAIAVTCDVADEKQAAATVERRLDVRTARHGLQQRLHPWPNVPHDGGDRRGV